MNHMDKVRRITMAVGAGSMLAVGLVGGVLAVGDGGTTSATVNSTISIAAPATIAFGAGIAGDTLSSLNSAVTVVSNNGAGYTLSVQGSALTNGANSIPATAMSFRDGAAAYAPLTAADANLLLASTSAETDADGTDHLIDAQLVLPFVEAGDYDGTFLFTASNL